MDITVTLTHEELTGLMRSLLRSLQETPELERALHEALFDRISQWHIETLSPEIRSGLAHALASWDSR